MHTTMQPLALAFGLLLVSGALCAQTAQPEPTSTPDPMSANPATPAVGDPTTDEVGRAIAQAMAQSGGSAAPRVSTGNALSAEEVNFARQEEDLLRQIRLMQLRVSLRDLQRKMVDEKEQPQPIPAAPVAESVIDVKMPDPIMLVGIWGPDEDLRADFFIRGFRYTAAVGTTLPEGWLVTRITRTGVEARKGRERRTFVFGEQASR